MAIDRGGERRRGMVDNVNPTNQFHPYQPPEELLPPKRTLGGLERVRDYAKRNPGMVLGGLAAAAIGLGMMRRTR
jgi:hypothetical protein